jgi:DNA-binding Lrp family transcriptional regulator
MKLSAADSELLYLLESNADLSFKQLAKRARCKEYTVRRAFHRFLSQGLITGRAVYVNTMRLGLTDHALYFSLGPHSSKGEHPVIRALQLSPFVRWLADVGGVFDYSVTFLAPSVGEVREFLDKVSTKYKNAFLGKQLALRTYMVRYPRRYLSNQRSWSSPFAMGQPEKLVTIDATDQAILFRLSNGSFETDVRVAQAVGISPSALTRRIANLKEKEVLVGHTYRVNMGLLGYSSFRILLVMKRLGTDLRERMVAFCQTHIAVRIMIESFGSWDYELELELPHTRAIKQFTSALHDAFMNEIYTLQVIPIFQHLKYSGYPNGKYLTQA